MRDYARTREMVYASVRDGVAVLICRRHPGWTPRIMGNSVRTIDTKIRLHAENSDH